MQGNYLICQNRVVVEGQEIGQFVECTVENTRTKLCGTCSVSIPFYSIAAKSAVAEGKQKAVGKNLNIYRRIDTDALKIKMGARIEVYASYKDNDTLGHRFEECKIFDGYIREIVGGFPTVLKCEDLSFPLRFGTVTKSWFKAVPLKTILNDIIPIANQAFADWRAEEGRNLTYDAPAIEVDGESVDFNAPFKTSILTSPYEIIENIVVRTMKMFASVNAKDGKALLFCGTARPETSQKTIDLSTAINVIGRKIVPQNNFFENFRVVVTYNAQADQTSKYEVGSQNGTTYELPYQGDNMLEKDIKQIGDNTLASLKANRNKGTITTLLYPKIELYDYINFTDTIFSELSGGYAVIGYKLVCNSRGYHQELTVTNKTFLYLAN